MVISVVQWCAQLISLIERQTRPRSVGIFGIACLFLCAAPCSVNCAAQTRSNSAAYKQTILAIQEKIESGNLEEARSLIARAAGVYPRDGGIENLLGVIEIEQGHTDAAAKAFFAAIIHSPRLAGAYLNLSRIRMATAATDPTARREALRLSLKAIELEPANDEAHYQAATLYAWNKDYHSSLQQLQKLSTSSRAKIGAQALFCADYAAIGDSERTSEAARSLENNPELSEQDADTCLTALRSARRADLIEELFSAAATHQALSPEGLRILGLAQEAEAKLQAARTTLESAFAANSTSVDILEDLARVAKTAGDNQGALGYIAHARDLEPKNASLAYEFAVICVRMSLLAEARKALTEALRLDPDNPEYNLGMGIVVSFSSDPSQALPYLTRYHELHPNDAQGVLQLGAASYRAKEYDTAVKWLRLAAFNQKTAPEAHYYLGRIARQEGRLEEATAELKQVLALRPGHPDSLAELGQLCVQNRDFPQAASYFDKALRADPDNYAANFGLLQLYARTGDSRRDQQSQRFDQIKNMQQEQEKEMMRVIEVRPNEPTSAPH
jgi:tetratricopeptide (TPR) repeat protein